jgi:uncharacterized protein YgiM (DUF1202 family)
MRYVWLMTIWLTASASFASEVRYVRAMRLELKSSPSMSAAMVGKLVRGEKIEVRETRGIWLRVSHAGREGWVPSFFVTVDQIREIERTNVDKAALDKFRSSARLSAY